MPPMDLGAVLERALVRRDQLGNGVRGRDDPDDTTHGLGALAEPAQREQAVAALALAKLLERYFREVRRERRHVFGLAHGPPTYSGDAAQKGRSFLAPMAKSAKQHVGGWLILGLSRTPQRAAQSVHKVATVRRSSPVGATSRLPGFITDNRVAAGTCISPNACPSSCAITIELAGSASASSM